MKIFHLHQLVLVDGIPVEQLIVENHLDQEWNILVGTLELQELILIFFIDFFNLQPHVSVQKMKYQIIDLQLVRQQLKLVCSEIDLTDFFVKKVRDFFEILDRCSLLQFPDLTQLLNEDRLRRVLSLELELLLVGYPFVLLETPVEIWVGDQVRGSKFFGHHLTLRIS